MKFRVDYTFIINGKEFNGVETEGSWFLIDQQGNMYSHSPLEPIRPIGKEYTKAVPLIKIKNEWLSIEEIERRLKNV